MVIRNQKIYKYLTLFGSEYFVGVSGLEVQIYKIFKRKPLVLRRRNKLQGKRSLTEVGFKQVICKFVNSSFASVEQIIAGFRAICSEPLGSIERKKCIDKLSDY